MIEDEAKTKFCPGNVEGNVYCIGSACMAWRGEKTLTSMPGGNRSITDENYTEFGYCGLAGKP